MGKKTDFILSVWKKSKPVAKNIGRGAVEVAKTAGTVLKFVGKAIVAIGKIYDGLPK